MRRQASEEPPKDIKGGDATDLLARLHSIAFTAP